MNTRNLIIIFFAIGFCVTVFMWFSRDTREKIISRGVSNDAVERPTIVGTTYFVSLNGNDSLDGMSQNTSFASLQKAFDVMQPGDGVVMMDGVYTQDVITVRNGTKEKPITVTGSVDAILQGTGDKARIVEINHDYITLYGFTIDGLVGSADRAKNYRDKLIYIEGKELQEGVEGVRIVKMHLKNAGGECVRVKYFSHHNEIVGNTIVGCGAYDFLFDGKGKNGEGIYIGTAPEQVEDDKNISRDIDRSNYNHVHNNMIDTQGNECVDIKEGASFNIVEKNVCTGQKDKESAGLDSRGNNNVFRENEVYDCLGAGIRLGGDEDDDGINNDVIKNHLHDNAAGGIKFQAKPQGNICENIIKNNKKGDLVGEYGDDMRNDKSC